MTSSRRPNSVPLEPPEPSTRRGSKIAYEPTHALDPRPTEDLSPFPGAEFRNAADEVPVDDDPARDAAAQPPTTCSERRRRRHAWPAHRVLCARDVPVAPRVEARGVF